MALWEDFLQEGSYDGVKFDFVRASVEGGNTLDKQEFPNRDGYFIQGRARVGRRFEILAIFIEDDYPDTMNRLLNKLENGGEPAEFVDPVFGSFQAACERFTVQHDADEAADSATVQITFVEHTEGNAGVIGVQNTTPARANSVRSAATVVLEALSAFQEATEVQNNDYVLEVTAAVNAANDLADSFEAAGDDLSALDVQVEANETMALIEAAVESGADYDSTEAYDLGAAVLAMSGAVSSMAEELIEAKPPLQEFIVPCETNLLTFAFGLYGDSSRADEILSLNSIPDPSQIPAGTRIKAYAE